MLYKGKFLFKGVCTFLKTTFASTQTYLDGSQTYALDLHFIIKLVTDAALQLTVPVYDILAIDKKMTALFIPNAIQITSRQAKYAFASFLSRDTTYDVIHNVWRSARPDAESIISGEASARGSLDDPSLRELGSISEKALTPVNKRTECQCGKDGVHYPETAMSAVFPGTPEQIYNLMFASGFIKNFLIEDQKLQGPYSYFCLCCVWLLTAFSRSSAS